MESAFFSEVSNFYRTPINFYRTPIIRKHAKKRMVEAEKFSEMLDARLAEYLRGLISNEEVIKELLKMAQELKANAEQASELGLTEEKQAFYDALTKP